MTAQGPVVIVGAGEAGIRTALELRQRGFDGAITVVGDERHLPYERPPLSKDALTAADLVPPRSIADKESLAASGIELRLGARVTAIDRARSVVTLSDGPDLPYAALVLATGASPRRLPIAEGSKRCVYLRTHEDSLVIRTSLERGGHVVIVGGGFIGLEIAASARQRGCAVTVVEAQPRLLMRGVPAEIAAAIHDEHEANGVLVRTNTGLRAIEDGDAATSVVLSTGDILLADLVVIGIGAVPNTALAEDAGLAIDNGIAVDAHLRSSDPTIYAVGDCASFPASLYDNRRIRLESWRNTHDQAKIAAENLMGGSAKLDAVPWFWSDQYGLGLQVAGLVDAGARLVRRDLGEGAFILFSLAEDGRLVAASGIGPGNAVARDIRLAEMLIARRAHPSPEALASAATKLKALLA